MWENPQETADLFIFVKENLDRKLHFLCIVGEMKIFNFLMTSMAH